MRSISTSIGFLVLTSVCLSATPQITFVKTKLDGDFRSEGVAVGDFNRDGLRDIAAGFVWYQAPDWKMKRITADAKTVDPKGYSNSFVNYMEDVNHDGWDDLIVVDFPGTPTWWFENPKQKDGDRPWTRHQVTQVSNNESPQYIDVIGDGRRELVMGVAPDPQQPDGEERRMAILSPKADPNAEWNVLMISVPAAPGTQKYNHGLGIGDLNGDGKSDVFVPQGWWQQPTALPENYGIRPWTFHSIEPALGKDGAHMYTYDFDGDGDQDLLSSSPHAYGIWWHERVGENKWVTHVIDDTISQTHAVCMADIDGDGLEDFITGKRWWAHASGDPGIDDPAVICWYQLQRVGGKATWIRHQFDDDSGVGTQFQVVDVDGDQLLDVVTSNKKGVHYFRQVRQVSAR